MKLSLLFFSMISILFYSTCIHFSLMNQSLRKQEQELSLKHALTYTMNRMNDTMTCEEVLDLFKDDFFKQVNSLGDYTIHIYTIDREKGFLDVEVIQDFFYLQGNRGQIRTRYQILKERYTGG